MPENSSLRRQFENRLFTNQPTATFALTNTLAGFLVPWIVVAVSVLARQWVMQFVVKAGGGKQWPIVNLVAISLCTAMAGVCLGLTESRSAMIGLALGLPLGMFVAVVYPRPVSGRLWLRVTTVILVATLGALAVATVLHSQSPLLAARKSLGYRFQYWHATAQMIKDHPIVGCGPGQFQDTYTRYKLPAASEEVQDPHNWLLETWATAGTPAAVALVAVLAIVVIETWKAGNCVPAHSNARWDDESLQDNGQFWAPAGALIGVLLGTALSWLSGFAIAKVSLLLMMAGVIVTWLALGPWRAKGPLPGWLPLVAVFALLLNLVAAGSIGYPCLADSLWLLTAVTVNSVEIGRRGKTGTVVPPALAWTGCCMVIAALVTAMFTAYLPVLDCRLQLDLADSAVAQGHHDLRRQSLEAAVAADRWSAAAAQQLAAHRFYEYQQQPHASVLRRFEAANRRALELAPARSALWSQSADWHREIHARTHDERYLQTALSDARRAIALYPHHARLLGQLADLLALADRPQQARAAAKKALQLDDQMLAAGHDDRVMDPAMRRQLQRLATSN